MSVSTLEVVARDVFERRLHERSQSSAGVTAEAAARLCPVSWLLPELLQMIAERHAEPVDRLRPAIRKLIGERAGLYACAAGMSADEADDVLDQHVDLMVRVLEEVRGRALEEGRWSEMGTGPEMFG